MDGWMDDRVGWGERASIRWVGERNEEGLHVVMMCRAPPPPPPPSPPRHFSSPLLPTQRPSPLHSPPPSLPSLLHLLSQFGI